MSEPCDKRVTDALVGWDPAARHELDEPSFSRTRRAMLGGQQRCAGGRDARGWFAAAAAAVLAVAVAMWSTRAIDEAPAQAPQVRALEFATAAAFPPTAPTAQEAPAAASSVVAAAVEPSAPPAGASPAGFATRDAPARRSRIDFRTSRGTRLIWLLRSDFEAPAPRPRTF